MHTPLHSARLSKQQSRLRTDKPGGIAMEHKLVRKVKDSPDETRPFTDGKGKMEVFLLGDSTVGRGEFEPGWRWSQHVKPIAGTPSCQATHTGYVLEGRMVVKMDDGSEREYGPGAFF